MTHASLFSGIGGAEIAAAWLGWENLFHCDINEFGRKVLGYWFPQSREYNDIKTTDFTEWRGRVDVLTAGFPCQPFSVAGKRRGADDDRYLWPETLRAINEIRPAWFVGENVFGIASMVLPGEEVDMGRTDDLFEEGNLYRTERRFVLDRICRDIEDAGYTVQPVVIPACAVGAPHRRDRVWFVARREDVGHDAEDTDRHGRGDRVSEVRAEERGQRVSGAGDHGRLRGDLADPDSDGFHKGDGKDEVIADERRVDELGDACEGGPHSSSHSGCVGRQGRSELRPGSESGEAGASDAGGHGFTMPSSDAARREREAPGEGFAAADGRGRDLLLQGGRGDEVERAGGLAGVPRADAESRGAGLQEERSELPAAGLQEERSELPAAGSSGGVPQASQQPDSGRAEESDGQRPGADARGGLRGDVPGERQIPRFQGWEGFPTQPPVCRGDDGLPFGVADLSIPFGRWRREAIKALGNAWVPEVAYEIFRMIQMVEDGHDYD